MSKIYDWGHTHGDTWGQLRNAGVVKTGTATATGTNVTATGINTNPGTYIPLNPTPNTTYPIGGTAANYITCPACGFTYLAGAMHNCIANQKPMDYAEDKVEDIDPLTELKRSIAENIGMLETYLGFVDEQDQAEQLDEASYYLREAMKIVRKLHDKI
jgi:hypothetical protein